MDQEMYASEGTYGLHEIHITVDPRQIFQLRFFCKDKNMKPILAVSERGHHPHQLMISKFKNGSAAELIKKAGDIAEDMRGYGLTPIRIKVESMMNNEGAPRGDQKPKDPRNYWEFHLKIPVESLKENGILEDVCERHGAAISFNSFKPELVPLVTLRLYETSYDDALKKKAALIEDIKSQGFSCNRGIQSEFSIYDTNQSLDGGWLNYSGL